MKDTIHIALTEKQIAQIVKKYNKQEIDTEIKMFSKIKNCFCKITDRFFLEISFLIKK